MTWPIFVIAWLLVLHHAVAWLTYAALCAVVDHDRRSDEDGHLLLRGVLWFGAWFWPITCITIVLLVRHRENREDVEDLED